MISIDSFENNNFNSNMGTSVSLLKRLYEKSGNCSLSGFLGDSIESIFVDNNGHLEFISRREDEKIEIITNGMVLSDSIVMMQRQNSNSNQSFYLYCWDSNSNLYTYLQFDNETSLNDCYDRLKKNDMNLCSGDVSAKLQELGVSYDNISQILLNKDIDDIYSSVDVSYEGLKRK